MLDQDLEVNIWRQDHGYAGPPRSNRPRHDGFGSNRDPLERFMGGVPSGGAGIKDFRFGAWR